jgi:hypothetical protein
MAVQCKNCYRQFDDSSDGRLPPWCPRCGVDLARGAVAVSPSMPPAAPISSVVRAAAAVVGVPVRPPPVPATGGQAAVSPAVRFDESRPIAVHDFSLKGYLHKLGPALMLSLIFLALAVFAFCLAVTRPGSGTLAPGLFMAGLSVAFLFPVFAGYGKAIRRVEVFADGITWHGPGGTGRLAWQDVAEVYRSEIIFNGFRKSELKLLAGGREVTFDLTLDRYPELAGLVQARSAAALRDRMREEARTGSAGFGPVAVNAVGVSVEGESFPWDSVTRYEVAGGRLWFQLHDPVCRRCVSLHAVPNYMVLLYLLGEFAPPAVREASGVIGPAG